MARRNESPAMQSLLALQMAASTSQTLPPEVAATLAGMMSAMLSTLYSPSVCGTASDFVPHPGPLQESSSTTSQQPSPSPSQDNSQLPGMGSLDSQSWQPYSMVPIIAPLLSGGSWSEAALAGRCINECLLVQAPSIK